MHSHFFGAKPICTDSSNIPLSKTVLEHYPKGSSPRWRHRSFGALYKVLAKQPAFKTRSVTDFILAEDIELKLSADDTYPKLAERVDERVDDADDTLSQTYIVFNPTENSVISLSDFKKKFKLDTYANRGLKTPGMNDYELDSVKGLVGFDSIEGLYEKELSELSTKEEVLDYLQKELIEIMEPLLKGDLGKITVHGNCFAKVTELALARLDEGLPRKSLRNQPKTNEDLIKAITLPSTQDKASGPKTPLIFGGALVDVPDEFFKMLNHPKVTYRKCPNSNKEVMIETSKLNSMEKVICHRLNLDDGNLMAEEFLVDNGNVYDVSKLTQRYQEAIHNSTKATYSDIPPPRKIRLEHLKWLGYDTVKKSVHRAMIALCDSLDHKGYEKVPNLIDCYAELVAKGFFGKEKVLERLSAKFSIEELTWYTSRLPGSDTPTPISFSVFACKFNKPKVIEEISKYGNINQYATKHEIRNHLETTASCLHFGIVNKSYEAIEMLLNVGYLLQTDSGQKTKGAGFSIHKTCLAAAIINKDERMIRLLRSYNYNLAEDRCVEATDQRIQNGPTTLRWCSSLQLAALNNYPEFLDILEALSYQLTDSTGRLEDLDTLVSLAKKNTSTAFLDKLSRDYGYENTDEADQPSQANGS